MKEGKELYKKADLPAGAHVEPCPVCGADAELWQYSTDFKNGPIDKVLMCSNGDRFGPQDGGDERRMFALHAAAGFLPGPDC